MAAARQPQRPTGHDQQVQHASSVAGTDLKINRDEFWRRSGCEEVPDKPPAVVLADLVRHTPGEEGRWFATAKDAKLFDEAVAIANATQCDPKTLTRAARDFARTNPAFAVEAGLAALRWLVRGHGYEVAPLGVRAAFQTLAIARS